VALLLPQRTNPVSFGHSTAAALRAALEHAQHLPQSLRTPAQAFAAALNIGRDSAWRTLADKLRVQGQQALLPSDGLQRNAEALRAALAQAQRAFDNGRFANNAFTLRMASDTVSAIDQHMFIDGPGPLRRASTISAEGAHSLDALRQMIGSSEAPEHVLAVRWLLHEGRLDVHSLARSRQIMGRFIRSLGGSSAAQMEHTTHVLGQAIAESRQGEDIAAVLDLAAERIRAAVKPS
jgi:hypothetical protein